MNDSIRRDDMRQTETTYSASTTRALKRAASRGAANLTADMVQEIGERVNLPGWLMVNGRQVAIEGQRAFRL